MGRRRKVLPLEFRELFPVVKNSELAVMFGVSESCVRRLAKYMGLDKAYPVSKNGNNHKRVLQMGADGEPIRVYRDTKEASSAMGRKFGYNLIREVCRGVRPLAYGFKWRYCDEETSADYKNRTL